jgi:UDP-N-acetylglucosamine 1-carboxyvinyltransferase
MTDWQQPLAVLCTQARGLSVIHETVFEGRFGYVDSLVRMGASIELYDQCLGGSSCRYHESNYRHSAVISGPAQLHGAETTVPDVRGGFAYLLAAAAAEGSSTLDGVGHIERGYHRPREQFAQLGLDITSAP